MKNITLQDIANMANCSKNTASLILRGATKFSQELTDCVKKTAKKNGYIPNYAARNLASRKSDIVGIYTATINDPVRAQIVNDLITNIHNIDYKPFLGIGSDYEENWLTSSWFKTFKYLNVALLVLVAHGAVKPIETTKDVPLLILGCQPPERNIKCDYIALDRSEVAQIAIDHLTSKGYEYILNACSANSIIGHKFLTELKKMNLSYNHCELNIKDSYNELIRIINIYYKIKSNKRKAIFFSDSLLAIKFMEIAIKAKIKIPKELAVISYDFFPWADALKVPLTTICQPIEQMSQRAKEIIKYRLEHNNLPYSHETLSHKLVIRKST